MAKIQPIEIHDRLVAEIGERQLEAVSVLVIDAAPVNEAVARAVAPLVAKALYPGRSFGAVLHIERAEKAGSWYVAVEVVGTPFSAVTIGRPAPAER